MEPHGAAWSRVERRVERDRSLEERAKQQAAQGIIGSEFFHDYS